MSIKKREVTAEIKKIDRLQKAFISVSQPISEQMGHNARVRAEREVIEYLLEREKNAWAKYNDLHAQTQTTDNEEVDDG